MTTQTLGWDYRRALYLAKARDAGLTGCMACSKQLPLDVHHISYDFYGNDRDVDLVALCRKCHTDVHTLERRQHKGLLHATEEVFRRRGKSLYSIQQEHSLGRDIPPSVADMKKRRKSYNKVSFSLSDAVIEQIRVAKERSGLSYNLFFKRLLDGTLSRHYPEEGKAISPDRAYQQTSTRIYHPTSSDGLGDEGATHGNLQDTG